jgi:hypothetical protein
MEHNNRDKHISLDVKDDKYIISNDLNSEYTSVKTFIKTFFIDE